MLRTIRGFAVLSLFLVVSATLASAQSGSVYYAGGTATDSAAGPIDTLGAGVTYNAPRIGGFFDTIGADVIFYHNLGVGAEVSFRNSKGPYAGLEYRPTFYDVNAVYQPVLLSRRLTPEIQAGFGRANVSLFYTPRFCLTYQEGCRSTTAEVTSASHLQLHFSAGLRYYVYKSFFVRPQVDIRWVHNFSYFGSSLVPEYTLAFGYTIRRGR